MGKASLAALASIEKPPTIMAKKHKAKSIVEIFKEKYGTKTYGLYLGNAKRQAKKVLQMQGYEEPTGEQIEARINTTIVANQESGSGRFGTMKKAEEVVDEQTLYDYQRFENMANKYSDVKEKLDQYFNDEITRADFIDWVTWFRKFSGKYEIVEYQVRK